MAKRKKAPRNLDSLPEGGLLESETEIKKNLKTVFQEENETGLNKSERKKVTFLIHPSLHRKLKMLSVDSGKSVSDILEGFILKGTQK